VNESDKVTANHSIKHVITNLEMRFTDDVSSLCSLHKVLQQRIPTPDFSIIAKILRALRNAERMGVHSEATW